MSNYHQTIVVELGSSRIKVGFAGESTPRRVLHGENVSDGGSGGSRWWMGANDGFGVRDCNWKQFFCYYNSTSASDPSKSITSSHISKVCQWEPILYFLFSHILTSILFLPRPSRHRVIVLVNDFIASDLREALESVLVKHLGVGGILIVNGGGFATLLLEGLPRFPRSLSIHSPTSVRPKAYMFVDIGAYEARVLVSMTGSMTEFGCANGGSGVSYLTETYQIAMAGHQSFLKQVVLNYREWRSDGVANYCGETRLEEEDEGTMDTKETSKFSDAKKWATNPTLDDANQIVRAWIAISSLPTSDVHCEVSSISVCLPSLDNLRKQHLKEDHVKPPQFSIDIPTEPLLRAFHQMYADFTQPSSLIYSILSSALATPVDIRRTALQNILLLGGGSVALRHFMPLQLASSRKARIPYNGGWLCFQLERAAREACGVNQNNVEEKKDEEIPFISSIARHRFQCLRGAVSGNAATGGKNEEHEHIEGIHVRYPDPFAADMAAWVGGSIMGSLGLKNECWSISARGASDRCC